MIIKTHLVCLKSVDLTLVARASNPKLPVIIKPLEYNKLHVDDRVRTNPYDIFEYIINFDQLIDFIVLETSRYANFKGDPLVTTSEEITTILGIVVMIGYHKLLIVRSYWSTDDDLHVENVSKIMPVLRLEKDYKKTTQNSHASFACGIARS